MIVAVWGAKGNVGKEVVAVCKQRGHRVIEIDVENATQAIGERADIAINFSTPQATQDVVRYCTLHRCALIDGVTGRTEKQMQLLSELAQIVTVCQSVNFSQGATLLTEIAAHVAQKVGWDCEITEIHRKNKRDAPSGTAKQIAAAVLQARGGFSSATIHSLRCGNCCGTHTVIFGGDGERLEITHIAENRKVFALGAVLKAEEVTKGK